MCAFAGPSGAPSLRFSAMIEHDWGLVRTALAVAAATLMCGPRATRAQTSASAVHDLLVRELGFSAADLAAVSRGEIVAKPLPTSNERDVAVMAMARVGPDVRASLATSRTTISLFAQPASPADVQRVRVTREDVDELRKCHPGSCNFKLPVSDMDAVRAAIDSAGPDAPDRVTAYVRQRMVEYVNAYQAQGGEAMVVYADAGSVRSSAAFDGMMRDSSRLLGLAPAFARYMDAYPRDSLTGATSTILWSVDAMPRLRPVMRIMHQVVYAPPDDPGTSFVVSKQLYADHYFEAGLETLLLTDARNAGFENAGGAAVLLEVRRYRFDHLPSGGLLDLRGRVVGGLRAAVFDDVRQRRDGVSRGSPMER
jgi:hypothetical protein